MKRKILSLIMACAITLSLVVSPAVANAEEMTSDDSNQENVLNGTEPTHDEGDTTTDSTGGATEGDVTTPEDTPQGEDPQGTINPVPTPPKTKSVDGLEGAGTAENPYKVGSVDDLKFVAEKVNAGDTAYNKAYYKLTADIDLDGEKNWVPIGTETNKFMGNFEGTGFTIRNLHINDAELEYAGLFGCFATPAKLTGITVENADITAKSNVGVIAGGAYTGSAENCTVKGKITVAGNYKVGGMFGSGYAKLSNCKVDAAEGSTVTGTYLKTDLEGDNVGGLIGFRGEGSTITTIGCFVSGVTVAGSRKVGGLVGSAFADNTYEDCSVENVSLVCNAPYDYAKGTAKNQLCVGGIVGMFSANGSNGGKLSECSVSNVDFSVTDEQVKTEDWAIMGVVSGGYRAGKYSLSATTPDSVITVEDITISGENTGSNAEEKFPGSYAMNGTTSVLERGTGTEADPYIVSTVEELKLFARTVNETGLTYEGQYIKIADSVTEFDVSEGWNAIGSSTKKFKGTFDGNGKTIKGLTKSFFGGIEDATIKNMKLEDVNITNAISQGALVSGYLYGSNTIDGIEVAGVINGSSYGDYVGGIIGGRATTDANDVQTITNCINRATITGNYVSGKVGGIVGYTNKSNFVIENCENYGDITSKYWAGGITAGTITTEIISCVNEGKVSGVDVAGGIVGTANGGTKVTDSKNTGDVICADKAGVGKAGGIIGNSSSGSNTVSKSANTGNITGTSNAGGIIGGTDASGDAIDNCYNNGAITASANGAFAGGIYGYNNSSCDVKACFNEGTVSAEKVYQIGKSGYWFDQATGSKIQSCYYIEDETYYLASENGDDPATEQPKMTRKTLASTLNKAGGVKDFWREQNDTVQPKPLIPGVFDGAREAVILDEDGNIIEGYADLQKAIDAAKDGQTVKMEKNVEYLMYNEIDTITVSGEKNITLDLNGHNLAAMLKDVIVIEVKDKANLTLTDTAETKGKVEGLGGSKPAICVRGGASMITKDVVINYADEDKDGADLAVQVQGKLTVEDGTVIKSTEGGIYPAVVDKNEDNCEIIINGGTITTEEYAIGGNGKWSNGSTITVNGGTLIANKGAGIYHPQSGTLTLNGGKIEGLVGVQMCGGNLVVPANSKVEVVATGEDEREGRGNNDGVIKDGAAISIIDRNYPNGTPTATIEGGKFVSEKAEAILAYTCTKSNTGYEYSDWGNVGEYVEVSGGLFNTQVAAELLADGYGLKEPNADGLYVVHEHKMKKIEGAPTCTEVGATRPCYFCEVCGKYFEDFEDGKGLVEITDVENVILPATGHKAETKWSSDKDNHWHVCKVCGAKIDLAAHDFKEAGEKVLKCKVCGLEKKGTISESGGDEQSKPDKNKTPETGDNSNLLLYVMLMVLAGTGVVTVRRKVQK